jgi:hypothetical protein
VRLVLAHPWKKPVRAAKAPEAGREVKVVAAGVIPAQTADDLVGGIVVVTDSLTVEDAGITPSAPGLTRRAMHCPRSRRQFRTGRKSRFHAG